MAELHPDDYADMIEQLEGAETLADMFDIIEDFYVIEECEVGTLTKTLMIANLKKAIKMLKPQPR